MHNTGEKTKRKALHYWKATEKDTDPHLFRKTRKTQDSSSHMHREIEFGIEEIRDLLFLGHTHTKENQPTKKKKIKKYFKCCQ